MCEYSGRARRRRVPGLRARAGALVHSLEEDRLAVKRSAWILPLSLLLVAARAPVRDGGLHPVQTITLPGVEGRIDHLAADVDGGQLFVAALGNNSVEVVGLWTGERIHSISGLRGPQGVAFARRRRLFVTDGQGGVIHIYDSHTFKEIKSVSGFYDADNIRFWLLDGGVFVGYGNGALCAMASGSGEKSWDLDLGGHPESFQLGGPPWRIFVNVPSENEIVVVDPESRQVIAKWPISDARANFPMALDEAGHRLFVGCRQPARLLVWDTNSGLEVGKVAIDGDADDVFYDFFRKQLYVSCGAGFLDIIQQADSNSYSMSARLPTAKGARTCLYVPEIRRLYLAVPHRGTQGAEIRVFAAGP